MCTGDAWASVVTRNMFYDGGIVSPIPVIFFVSVLSSLCPPPSPSLHLSPSLLLPLSLPLSLRKSPIQDLAHIISCVSQCLKERDLTRIV